ncbi:hypothetical protein CFAM422_009344, partial [Trichoderma lentiforme]
HAKLHLRLSSILSFFFPSSILPYRSSTCVHICLGNIDMAEPQYTVFIRVPIPRRGFVDPPAVSWDTAKDDALWKILSQHGEIDCMMRPSAETDGRKNMNC